MLNTKQSLIITTIFISSIVSLLFSQTSTAVDMMPALAGTQNLYQSSTEGETFSIDIIGSGFDSLFSYQLKLSFDTSKLEFVGADKDYGFTGTRNFLTQNGGTIQGICQKQINPPCDSVLEFAYTIVGNNNAQAVSGEGLLGVVWLRSKLALGESSTFTISQVAYAQLNGDLTLIDTIYNGTYSYSPVANINQPKSQIISPVKISYKANSTIIVNLGNETFSNFSLDIYTLSGEKVESQTISASKTGYNAITLNQNLSKGVYLCRFSGNNIQTNHKITVNK